MIKRLRFEAKAKSNSATSVAAPRLRLFGPPQILEGEDRAAYDELVARICDDIKPVDIIEEMHLADAVSLTWEVLRWRRLKSSLIRTPGLKALESFLVEQLESSYALHQEHFESYLAEILQNNLPKDKADSAERIAAECAPHDADANDKLDKVLHSIGLRSDEVMNDARALKAKELVQQYVRGEPDAVTLVHELLTEAGVSMDGFTADALAQNLDYIERIDRLTSNAEHRRNASLFEIERRRVVFGATLRRSVQEIEAGESKVIATLPAKGKNAA